MLLADVPLEPGWATRGLRRGSVGSGSVKEMPSASRDLQGNSQALGLLRATRTSSQWASHAESIPRRDPRSCKPAPGQSCRLHRAFTSKRPGSVDRATPRACRDCPETGPGTCLLCSVYLGLANCHLEVSAFHSIRPKPILLLTPTRRLGVALSPVEGRGGCKPTEATQGSCSP